MNEKREKRATWALLLVEVAGMLYVLAATIIHLCISVMCYKN